MTTNEREMVEWLACRGGQLYGLEANAIRACIDALDRAEATVARLARGLAEATQEASRQERRADEAMGALAAAPHAVDCGLQPDSPSAFARANPECSCWKSHALGREEAALIRAALDYTAEGPLSNDAAWFAVRDAAAALRATGRWP